MDADTLRAFSRDELERLPVFPLPRVVFFPGTNLPLHLFEPRYRDMIEDCLRDGPRAMAVTLLEPALPTDQPGPPPMRLVAGAGRIVAHERLANGTHNVVLAGVSRVRLEELPAEGKRYRRAHATVLHDGDVGAVGEGDRLAMLAAASSVVSIVRRDHPEFDLGAGAADPAGRLADVIADRLVSDVDRRQEILETLSVPTRVRLVTDAVSELLAMLSGSRRSSAPH